jgi:hypothetical protein
MLGLDVVIHACNLSRDWKDHHLRPARAKVSEIPSETNKLGMVGHPYNPSYFRRWRSGELWSEASLGKKHKTLSEK